MRGLLSRFVCASGVVGGLVALSCGGPSGKSMGGDGGGSDVGASSGDGESSDGAGGCLGVAPICCTLAPGGCVCPRDPPFFHATCTSGGWRCGPGSELELVCHGDSGPGPDSGGGGGGCNPPGTWSPPPACYGTDESMCCGAYVGDAKCVAGQYMCGSARASGCNGTICKTDAGGG
jgi:hypothetical protein